ncbi:hypothetical protein [Agreia bicolorata]|uniref:hypothetical protein n=1 Tax=Agreia bicolorata TaxID=110935 RepID=UPI00099A7B08|nr:hypothetical protein [Agreia bicolorata]
MTDTSFSIARAEHLSTSKGWGTSHVDALAHVMVGFRRAELKAEMRSSGSDKCMRIHMHIHAGPCGVASISPSSRATRAGQVKELRVV